MILIIGGAWQGKLDFAKETFGITDAEVFTCTGEELDFSKRCICAKKLCLTSFSLSDGIPFMYLSKYSQSSPENEKRSFAPISKSSLRQAAESSHSLSALASLLETFWSM